MADEPVSKEEAARKRAIETLARKRDVKRSAFSFGVTFLVLVVVWAATGGGYFWPIWAALGMGLALAYKTYDAYSRGSTPTSEQIEREIRRQEGE